MLQVVSFFVNILCLLFWQFTQFIFLTQLAIFFIMEQLKIIDVKTFSVFLYSHFCSLHTAVLLLQGNDMLKCSLYTTFLITVSVYCLFLSYLRIKIRNKVDLFVESWLIVLRILLAICLSWYLKKLLSEYLEIEEDSHVWDILYSKFTNYKTFHTLIYTCSEVFDFLKISSIMNMTKSLLIPFVLISCVNMVCHWHRDSLNRCKDGVISRHTDKENDENGMDKSVTVPEEKKCDTILLYLKNLRIESAVFYSISQMVVYGVMAALVMRLKLLFSTQMCLVSSLIVNKKYYL